MNHTWILVSLLHSKFPNLFYTPKYLEDLEAPFDSWCSLGDNAQVRVGMWQISKSPVSGSRIASYVISFYSITISRNISDVTNQKDSWSYTSKEFLLMWLWHLFIYSFKKMLVSYVSSTILSIWNTKTNLTQDAPYRL